MIEDRCRFVIPKLPFLELEADEMHQIPHYLLRASDQRFILYQALSRLEGWISHSTQAHTLRRSPVFCCEVDVERVQMSSKKRQHDVSPIPGQVDEFRLREALRDVGNVIEQPRLL